MHIARFNIRSMNKKMELIQITFQDSNATTVTISEVWLNSMYNESYIAIDGYKVERRDRRCAGRKNEVRIS